VEEAKAHTMALAKQLLTLIGLKPSTFYFIFTHGLKPVAIK
jgi:hypothetical protein